MAEATNSKLVGRIAGLLAVVGIISFFSGLFGAPRMFVLVGISLIVLSLAGYFVEEMGERKASRI